MDDPQDFRARFDRRPAVRASAPGRVNLVGGHTDYNDGLVLPVAIDRRTAVFAAPRADRTLRVHSREAGETATVDLDDPTAAGEWVDYVAGVAREVAALDGAGDASDAPDPDGGIPGADLLVAGDVPRGAGLSSSAALEVATGAALARLRGLDPSPAALALACWRAETTFVGVDCGIMDQFAAAACRAGHALRLDCRDRTYEHVSLPEDVAVVVVDTNVRHELADSAYNDRVAECRAAAETLAAHVDGVESLRDVTEGDLAAHGDALAPVARRRAEHVVTENERVREAAAALARGDLPRVGEALYASHGSLRDRYEVSCAELDLVVDLARTVDGVYGARMTGGGFGGSVVALVRPDAVDALADVVAARYPAETGVEADVYACRPDDGVWVRSVEGGESGGTGSG